jgi:hypothetical protein
MEDTVTPCVHFGENALTREETLEWEVDFSKMEVIVYTGKSRWWVLSTWQVRQGSSCGFELPFPAGLVIFQRISMVRLLPPF